MMQTTLISESPVLLSEEQQALVLHNEGEGALLVVAAAGSGKTRILTERVRYLLTQKPGKFSVLCLTFTNKAAEEMHERLARVPDIQRRAYIGTIHGFALQVLTARRHDLGYQDMPHILERENDRKKIVEQIFMENPLLKEIYDQKKEDREQQKLLDKCLNWISEQKRNLVYVSEGTTEYEGWKEGHLLLFTDYNRLLREQNMIDFEDILILAYRILTEFPAVARLYQRLYQYVLVDEAQDLNFAQYQFIKALCGESHRNVFMVGDPNQAINGYAGANRDYMMQHFIADFVAEKGAINKNYRSSQAVIHFANQVMPNDTKPEDAHYEGFAQTKEFSDEKEEAAWVFQNIKDLLNGDIPEHLSKLMAKGEIEGEISLDKIAVLARNKFVFRPLEELLNQEDYFKRNYFVKKTSEALDMETELMRLFDLGTRILCNPSNQLHLRQMFNLLKITAPPTLLGNDGFTKLKSLFDLLPPTSHDKSEFELLLMAWQQLTGAAVKMPEALVMIRESVGKQELSDEKKGMLLLDIGDYEGTWHKFLRSSAAGGISLAAFRQFAAMGSTVTQKNKGLTLSNVHSAKGLQFDIVFLIGMTDNTFPDYRSQTKEQLQEERNGAYVAVTRAKRWLFITYPMKKLMPWGDYKSQTPSRFIQPLLNGH